jgi:hypothetical protein
MSCASAMFLLHAQIAFGVCGSTSDEGASACIERFSVAGKVVRMEFSSQGLSNNNVFVANQMYTMIAI